MMLARLKRTIYDKLPLSTKLALKELVFRLNGSSTEIGNKPYVLVFDERIPTPERDAGSLRMMRVLEILKKRWEVIFVPFTNRGGCEHVLIDIGIRLANVAEYRRLIKSPQVVGAIVCRPSIAELFTDRIRRLDPRLRVIFDTVDVHFVRLQREYELTRDPATRADAERHREAETRLAREVDAIWCASVEDEWNIRQAAGGCDSVVISTLHEPGERGCPFAERKGLLFVGSFAHRPNEDAVLYFLREIFPVLQDRMPNIEFHIVGADPPDEVKSLASERVHVHGFVPDLNPLLSSVRVFVAPLRYGGAGTKGKVGEALAHGIPVVCTSIGAEGFGLTSGLDAMVVDDPQEFAFAINDIYSDRAAWERLASGGRARIEADFTPLAVSAKIFASIAPSRSNSA